jgi:rhodanese-related sulfurtransferase
VRVEDLLAEARAELIRLSPQDAFEAMRAGEVIVVDIREEERRERDGRVPGAI